MPIILVTAKGDDYDRVMGLDIGADDYIVKPFNGDEVMARVRAVLRRMGRSESTEEKKILNISDLTVNIETYTVYVGAEKLPMTKKKWRPCGFLPEIQARYLPGITCWTVCGGRIILVTAVPWIPISRDCVRN